MASPTESRWLDYAWSVLNVSERHRAQCVAGGAAVPGAGRVDGNELRWPGYLGVDYEPGRCVLCVGAVHREATLELHATDPVIAATDDEPIAGARAWKETGRSDTPGGLRRSEVRAVGERRQHVAQQRVSELGV